MTRLLAIETAETGCSAALWMEGVVQEHFEIVPRRHSELILQMVERVLADAGVVKSGIDAIAFGRGPGSFTGVRIATGVAQGIAYALDRPVVPVSTLVALAQGVFRTHGNRSVLPAFDARMHEVYWCPCKLGKEGLMRAAGAEEVVAPENVAAPADDGWCGAGSGWQSYGEILGRSLGVNGLERYDEALCHARDIAELAVPMFERGDSVAAGEALPVYLRNRVASVPSGN